MVPICQNVNKYMVKKACSPQYIMLPLYISAKMATIIYQRELRQRICISYLLISIFIIARYI